MSKEGKDPKEPILREEYERRHAALRKSYETFAKRSTRILTFLVIVGIASAAFSTYLLHQNSQQTAAINNSLVDNCEQNGNPLRAAVRKFGSTLIEQTQEDIEQSLAFEKAGTFAEILPDFPPDKLHEFAVADREDERQKIRGLRTATQKVSPVDCGKRFENP